MESEKESETKRICVKISNLRKLYKDDDITLKLWLSDSKNKYLGRNGRVFIEGTIFHYPGSIWANPYKLKEYSREESLKLYEKYIKDKIKNDSDYNLDDLRGHNLGCFCENHEECHIDILLKLIK